MDIYIKKENGISLQEWLDYVESDNDLVLMEFGEAVNPITKQKLKMEIEGRAVWGNYEILYKDGCVGCDDYAEELLAKMNEIAKALNAEIFE